MLRGKSVKGPRGMRLLRTLTRAGLLRGVLGGSRPWLVVGSMAVALRTVGRLSGRGEQVAFRGVLEPGETLVISSGTVEARAPAVNGSAQT